MTNLVYESTNQYYVQNKILDRLSQSGGMTVAPAEATTVLYDGVRPKDVTPLMQACQTGKESAVRQLIRKDPNSIRDRDRTGKTAVHYCVENNSLSCIEQVVELDPSLLASRDEDGYSPLHLATIAGNEAVVKFLLSKGADLHARDNENHTAVHWATVCGEINILEMLMDAGADASTPDIHGAYPIHYAAQMCGPNSELGHDVNVGLLVLQKLIQRGVDVTVRDHDGRQPLLWAASAEVRPSHVYCPSGSPDAILALINAGADVTADDKDGLTALHCAASRGHLDCLEVLINFCNAEVDILDTNGCTPLFYSVTLGHADCTEFLLRHGSIPDRQDRKGRTPAHCGAAKGQLETLKLLHRRGADMWKKNIKGDLPLHEACQSGRGDLVIWLLSLLAEAVNYPNHDGRCPLHIAAINNNVQLCKILMDHKATVNPIMRNSKGQLLTPVDASLAKGNKNCAQYLQLHGGLPASKLTDKRALQAAMQKALDTSPSGHTGATPTSLDEGIHTPSTISKTPISPRFTPSVASQTDYVQLTTESQTEDQGYGGMTTTRSEYNENSSGSSESDSEVLSEGGGAEKLKKVTIRRKRASRRQVAVMSLERPALLREKSLPVDQNDSVKQATNKDRQGTVTLRELHKRSGDNEDDDKSSDNDTQNEGERTASKSTRKSRKRVKVKMDQTQKASPERDSKVTSAKRAMSGGPRKVETVDKSLKKTSKTSPPTEVSITQAMQTTMRKYAMERRLFQQLLELKRIQLRHTKVNEGVLVKRMVDEYNKDSGLLGMRTYVGQLKFSKYEKYLYDQLRNLQSSQLNKLPNFKPTDDIGKLNRALRQAQIRELPESLDSTSDAQACSHSTHRCHHVVHAYTGVPCAAYLSHARKQRNGKNNKINLPRIPVTSRSENGKSVGVVGSRKDAKNPLTVELLHGSDRQQITLPTDLLDKSKKYQLTLSIQPSSNNTESSTNDPLNNSISSSRSAPEPSLMLQRANSQKELLSAPVTGRAGQNLLPKSLPSLQKSSSVTEDLPDTKDEKTTGEVIANGLVTRSPLRNKKQTGGKWGSQKKVPDKSKKSVTRSSSLKKSGGAKEDSTSKKSEERKEESYLTDSGDKIVESSEKKSEDQKEESSWDSRGSDKEEASGKEPEDSKEDLSKSVDDQSNEA